MNSFNHAAMAAVVSWMYSEMAGIKADSENAGYQHFYLQPTIDPAGGIHTVDGSYDSKYGTIVSSWTTEETTEVTYALKTYQASVPANTTATLYLPITEAQASEMESPEGMTYTGMAERNGSECAVFELESGSYNLNIA